MSEVVLPQFIEGIRGGDIDVFDASKWEPSSWPDECHGMAFTEVARGMLSHFTSIKDGKADPDVLPHEQHVLTLGSYGTLSFFQFKGALETILNRADVKDISFEPVNDNPSYHPGRCAKVLSGMQRLYEIADEIQ